ncbi:MAG: formate dehydrogenase accessory sulfurtransferase FdhD [Candidatus Atribacteria bacterium]|nr:MAG: formate dehydrogenase accessory sulfurtransferase FdhD [Candidatus Atribacteria bacterium]
MLKKFNCLKFDTNNFVKSIHEVVEELPLSIFINGRHFVTAMISPQMVREFVIGHLFSEKVIENINEIESIQIEENIVKVIISNPLKVISVKKLIVSGCGGGSSFLNESKLPKISSNLKIDAGDIFDGLNSLLNSDLHRITGGVHIVGLFHKKAVICISEDLGRHNALDKVIGCGLIKNINFKETFVVCTGRISFDMSLKCSVANIPIIISRGATTSFAIEIAEKTGLTTVGFARGRKMNIYTNGERICRIDTPDR